MRSIKLSPRCIYYIISVLLVPAIFAPVALLCILVSPLWAMLLFGGIFAAERVINSVVCPKCGWRVNAACHARQRSRSSVLGRVFIPRSCPNCGANLSVPVRMSKAWKWEHRESKKSQPSLRFGQRNRNTSRRNIGKIALWIFYTAVSFVAIQAWAPPEAAWLLRAVAGITSIIMGVGFIRNER